MRNADLFDVTARAERLIAAVPDALSPAECARLIREAEAVGFDEAPITVGPNTFLMATEVRNNTRVMRDDPALAALLWERVAAALPPTLPGGWSAIGLNERLRWYRYEPGQYFRWHHDGAYFANAARRSFFTVMFYLNDDFTGGVTEFDDGTVITPRRGDALLFWHPLRHQGATVRTGVKHVLRTDAMYRRA